jgi:hypothetical protein
LPLEHCVVAVTGCNLYFLDINIYFLSKKITNVRPFGFL